MSLSSFARPALYGPIRLYNRLLIKEGWGDLFIVRVFAEDYIANNDAG